MPQGKRPYTIKELEQAILDLTDEMSDLSLAFFHSLPAERAQEIAALSETVRTHRGK